jgi:hypothetical protein
VVAARARISLDPVADLGRRLSRCPARGHRSRVHRWWRDHGLAEHPAAVGKRVAVALIEQPRDHTKRAGIRVLAELLADQLRYADLVVFSRLFERGHLGELVVVDRFCTAVLEPMIAGAPNRGDIARDIASWRESEHAMQRRAACLAFIGAARAGESIELVLAVCAHVVWSHEACNQTGVGRLLGALGDAAPDRAAAFFRRHARLMSRDCARRATAPLANRGELLAHHRRATRFH